MVDKSSGMELKMANLSETDSASLSPTDVECNTIYHNHYINYGSSLHIVMGESDSCIAHSVVHFLLVNLVVELSCQPKVRHFQDAICCHQDVSSCQVTVDTLWGMCQSVNTDMRVDTTQTSGY